MTAQEIRYDKIEIEDFQKVFGDTSTEISSVALNGRIISCSDEFFEPSTNLLKVAAPVNMFGQFGPKGARFDGWETRRHNPTLDWVIVGLGPSSSIITGFDIDTGHFSGNEGPEGRVWGLSVSPGEDEDDLSEEDPRWTVILPNVKLGPASRHLFKIDPTEKGYSHVKLDMIPDGGLGRFRVYGTPLPPTPPPNTLIDLAYSLHGGRIVAASNQRYSPASNILLPGRGVDMSGGWECRRSRTKGNCDWAVVRLAQEGELEYVDIDTAYHMGNFPRTAGLHAINSTENIPSEPIDQWTCILPEKPMGPHRQHYFPLENVIGKKYTHVRLTIYPDGGLKRLRLMGYPSSSAPSLTPSPSAIPQLRALPLTYEAFLPYGRVVQGFSTSTAAPKGVVKREANQGTACKYHKMAPVEVAYPEGTEGLKTGVSVVRAQKQVGTGEGFEVKVLEKHDFSGQIFLPMGKAPSSSSSALTEKEGAYIAIVALSGSDGTPDMATMRAFLVMASQGVQYAPGVWHRPLLTADGTMDYAVIETSAAPATQISTTYYAPKTPMAHITIPTYPTPASLIPFTLPSPSALSGALKLLNGHSSSPLTIPCVPLTASAFAKFGQVVQAYGANEVPAGVEVDRDETFGTEKFLDLAGVKSSYPVGSGASTDVSLFRATVKDGVEKGKKFGVKFMERHPYTDQTFIPLGTTSWPGSGEDPLPNGASYLVICAENGDDDKPDFSTLKAFICSAAQGVNYTTNVWHHPMLTLGGTIDFACIETQIGVKGGGTGGAGRKGDERDCELLEFSEGMGWVEIPDF